MTTERDFVRQLATRFPIRSPVEVGIGDDGAVLESGPGLLQVVVTDMLLDGVHFDLRTTNPALAGRKAIAVNLSDLAAMGCRPTAGFISLAVPRDTQHLPDNFLRQLYDGVEQLTREYEFTLAGGDTNTWNGPFAINACLLGVPLADHPTLRSGARPGDALFVTGALGGSLHSQRHLTFDPRLAESEWLVRNLAIHAMMDVSDGLAIDLHRMMEASRTGCEIELAAIPIHADVDLIRTPDARLTAAMSDGEDFELLFAVSEADAAQLESGDLAVPCPMTRIGRVVMGPECRQRTVDGRLTELVPIGWQHSL